MKDMWSRTDTNNPRWLHRRIIQDALPHIIIEVCAVMVRLDSISFGIVGICVEGIQVRADSLHGLEVLYAISVEQRPTARPVT